MLMKHVPLVLINLLNEHRCIQDVIVIHISESYFSRESNKQQICNVVEMTARVKKILKSVNTHSVDCGAVYYSHMVSLPWYVGWTKQRAACRARARLSGTIAKCTQDCGAYVVPHQGIQAVQGEGFY